jgi:hypothetical protein
MVEILNIHPQLISTMLSHLEELFTWTRKDILKVKYYLKMIEILIKTKETFLMATTVNIYKEVIREVEAVKEIQN